MMWLVIAAVMLVSGFVPTGYCSYYPRYTPYTPDVSPEDRCKQKMSEINTNLDKASSLEEVNAATSDLEQIERDYRYLIATYDCETRVYQYDDTYVDIEEKIHDKRAEIFYSRIQALRSQADKITFPDQARYAAVDAAFIAIWDGVNYLKGAAAQVWEPYDPPYYDREQQAYSDLLDLMYAHYIKGLQNDVAAMKSFDDVNRMYTVISELGKRFNTAGKVTNNPEYNDLIQKVFALCITLFEKEAARLNSQIAAIVVNDDSDAGFTQLTEIDALIDALYENAILILNQNSPHTAQRAAFAALQRNYEQKDFEFVRQPYTDYMANRSFAGREAAVLLLDEWVAEQDWSGVDSFVLLNQRLQQFPVAVQQAVFKKILQNSDFAENIEEWKSELSDSDQWSARMAQLSNARAQKDYTEIKLVLALIDNDLRNTPAPTVAHIAFEEELAPFRQTITQHEIDHKKMRNTQMGIVVAAAAALASVSVGAVGRHYRDKSAAEVNKLPAVLRYMVVLSRKLGLYRKR